MTVNEIAKALELKFVAGESKGDNVVEGGFTSDMLSNVIGSTEEGDIWITMQVHSNILAVAILKDLAAIVIAQDEEPEAELIEQAEEKGVAVLTTSKSIFEVSAQIYNLIN